MGCIISAREKAHDQLDHLEHHIQEHHPHLRRIVSDMPSAEEKPLVLVRVLLFAMLFEVMIILT